MLRQLIRDSALYGAATLFSRAISFLLLPVYTRVLSPADYGVIELLLVLAALANVTVALEVSQAVARYFADAEPDERRRYASTALWFSAVAYTGFLIVALAAAPLIASVALDDDARAGSVRIAVLSVWAGSFFYLAQNQLRWELRATRYAFASLVYSVLTIGSTVAFVVGLRLGVRGVFLGYVTGSVLGSAVAFWFLRATYRLSFDREKLRHMLLFSVPLVPSSIGVFLSSYVDRIAVSRMLGIAELGVYAVAFRLASIVGLVLIALQTALTPLVYSRYREPDTPSELARIFRLFLLLAVTAYLVLSLFAREIVTAVAAPAFADAADLIPLLVPAILLGAMYVFAPGLFLAKRTMLFGAINIGAAVANIALNILLIPLLGLEGAAAATLTSAAIGFAIIMAVSQRFYAVPHVWHTLAQAVVVAIAMVVAALALGLLSSDAWSPGPLAAKAALALFGIGAGVVLLLQKDERARAVAWTRHLRRSPAMHERQ